MTALGCCVTLLVLAPALLALGQPGQQVTYKLIPRDALQSRLKLYKGNDNVREAALRKLFTEAGCPEANLSEQPVPHRKQPNVICTLPGTSADSIVVGAHFDHVSDGEGVIDNWSGASLLPSLFQSLNGSPRRHTFVFVGFTGEEEGLLGSASYVGQLSDDQLAHMQAMINLDTLALGPTKVWVSQSDPRLVSALGQLAQMMKLPLARMDVDGFGESDEESFIRDKICTLTIHSLTPQTTVVLHNSRDNPSAIRFGDYYDTFHLLAAYLAVLDAQLTTDGHVCNAKPIEMSGSRRGFPKKFPAVGRH
jgi:hypothetical protein